MKDKRDRAIMLAAQAQHISAFAHFLFISRQIITAMGVIITVDLISMPMAAAMPIRIVIKHSAAVYQLHAVSAPEKL